MNILKQIISLVLVSFLLLAATVSSDGYGDTEGNRYEKAIRIVTALELMKGYKDGHFKPDETMTRAETATVIAQLAGLDTSAQVDEDKARFPDVPSWHWAAPAVYAAEGMGILKGFTDGSFRPEQEVTYYQMTAMLIQLLGYEPYAYVKGGYPSGYLLAAHEKGITKNAGQAADTGITRGQAAQMIYNSLFVEVLRHIRGADRMTLAATEGNTLLYLTKGVKRERGVFQANEITSISRSHAPQKNTVVANQQYFALEDGEIRRAANGLLGYYTEFYYRERPEDAMPVIVYAQAAEAQNTVTEIAAGDIAGFTDSAYRYWSSAAQTGGMLRIAVPKSAALIYNGKLASVEDVNFTPLSGRVEMIEPGGEGPMVVKIWDYATHVVHSVDEAKSTVYAKYGMPSLTLDPLDRRVIFDISDTRGNSLSLIDLREWNVLSVAKSLDGDFVSILASSYLEEGVVDSTAANELSVGGRVFTIAASYQGRAAAAGDAVTVYLSCEEKVAAIYFGDADEGWSYGYVIKFRQPERGLDTQLSVKLFSEQGSIQSLTCANKVMVDNTPYSDHAGISAVLSGADKLVRYRLNPAGEISAIDTANFNAQGNESENTLRRIDPGAGAGYKKLPYKPSSRTFGGKILINEKTKILFIPSGDEPEDEAYKLISNLSYFYNDMEPVVAGYTTRKNSALARLLIHYQEAGSGEEVAQEETLAVVEKITEGLSKDEEHLKKLHVYKDGIQTFAYAKYKGNATIADGLTQGDVVHFSVDNHNIITALDVIYDVSENAFDDKAGNHQLPPHFSYNIFRVVLGSVYSVDEDIVRLIVGRKEDNGPLIDLRDSTPENMESFISNPDHIENYNPNYFKVYLYDHEKATNKVSLGSIGDIRDYLNFPHAYSKLIVHTRTGESRSIIILNGLPH